MSKLITEVIEFSGEQGSDPSTPAANKALLYTKDDGSGKTLLKVIVANASILTLATTVTTGLPGTLTAGVVNTKNPVVFNTQTTLAHGLGATPHQLIAYLECLSTEWEYAVGDRVPLGTGDGPGTVGYSVSSGATNTDISIGGGPVVIVKGGSTIGPQLITAAKWKIVVIPYKIN